MEMDKYSLILMILQAIHVINKERMMMKKIKVNIEEHLNKEIYIDVPNNVAELELYAEGKIAEKYKNGEIVLTSDDYNGVTLISIEDSEYYNL